VLIGFTCAVAAALCYGTASVLQAIGARRTASSEGIDPRLLGRLLQQPHFVVGSLLDVVGFGLALVALHTLPLYVVQVAIAANLAVSAVMASRVLNAQLSSTEWWAVAAVTAGLTLVGLSAGEEAPADPGQVFRWGLVVAAGLMTVLGVACGKMTGGRGAAVLGFISGLGFGIVSLAGRIIGDADLGGLLRDGAFFALAIAGIVGFLLHAVALQRGSVTTATVGVVLGETIIPVLIGVWLLGDTTRPGYVPVAVVGFVVAMVGALVLSRFGEIEPSEVPDIAIDPAAD
jgi:hypothetical protein